MKLAKIAKNVKEPNKKNIVLVGHMGSGKSLLGKLIAKKINYIHKDSDNLVEKLTGKKIKDIFEDRGELYFRELEEKTIIDISIKNNLVLSLGGGAILSPKVRKFIEEKFLSVFLDVNITSLVNRLKNSQKRPLLNNVNIKTKIKELDIIRRKYYLLSDIILTKHNDRIETMVEFENKYVSFYEKRN